MSHLLKFFCLVFFSFCIVVAQEEITAEGTGEAKSKEEALMAAKRDAIEKGIGMVLVSQTEVENFMLKRDQVITKTIGAVKSYQVLSETKATDGAVQIKIKATLSRAAMREDLAAFQILIESMDKPKVMVIISENNVGNDVASNQAAENAVIKFLRTPYGFEIVDPQAVAAIKASRQKMAALAGNDVEAATIGAQQGAEVLISGTAISRKAEEISQNLGGMVSVQADVTIRAINCTTGKIIGSETEHAAKVHISPVTAGNQAIGRAAEKAAQKLLDQIIATWQDQLNNGLPLTIAIKGVTAFKAKNEVIQSIQGVAGVSAVRERSWDSQSALLEIDVVYKGNSNGFCTKIDGYKIKGGAGSLAVTGVNGTSISLAAKSM